MTLEIDELPLPQMSAFWKRGGERELTVEWQLKNLVVAEYEQEEYRRERKRIQYANKRAQRAAVSGRKSRGKRPAVTVQQPVPSFKDWLDQQSAIAQPV